jgi:SAM-dependent methyltransferase
MRADTTSETFFERVYRQNPDPWSFASSPYEWNRYQAIFDCLNHRRYDRAFEPACSIGVLTAKLAAICGRIEATDIAATAVKIARHRCRSLPNVRVTKGSLPDFIPHGSFDLIVLSEVGYYFEENDLRELATGLVSRIRKPGVLFAAHWLGISSDHRLSGDRVHEVLRALDGLSLTREERHSQFRMDRWELL